MVTDNWYVLEFLPLSNAAWAAYSPLPTLPPEVLAAVRNGTTLLAYCIDDAGPLRFAYLGGAFTLPDDTVLVSQTLQTKNNTTMGDGEEWTNVRASSGAWLFYGSSSGVVRSLTSPSTLSTFLA